jgi:hypothetical protein
MCDLQRLKDAMLDVKFAQQAGTHIDGERFKPRTVDEALDFIAKRMGMMPVKLKKPLYSIDWNARKLHSNITGHDYWIDQLLGSGEYTVKYYGTWHGTWPTTEEAIDWLAHREREDNYEYAF